SVEMCRAIQCAEARKSTVEIKRRIGELRPAGQRQPMLDFLFTPMFDAAKCCVGRAAIYALQVLDIIGGIVFDQARGLDRRQQFAVDLCGVEAGPVDVVESPALTVNCSIGHPRTPWPMLAVERQNLTPIARSPPSGTETPPRPFKTLIGLQFL